MYKTIILSAIAMLVMDYIWLTFIAKPLYMQDLGKFFDIQNGSMQVNYFAAAIVYLGLLSGIFLFVLPRADSLVDAFVYGALFGLIIYGVYDFTNLATIKAWPLKISIIDMLWGGALCSATSGVGYIVNSARV